MTIQGIALRPATEGDHPYIFSTWINFRVRELSKARRPTEGKAYRETFVEPALAQGGRLYVACSESKPNALHGWICVLDGAVVAMYVHDKLRGQGLGRRLVEHALGKYAERIVTHHRWKRMSARFLFTPLPTSQRNRRAA